MNFLTKKNEKENYVHLSSFMHSSKQALYCQVHGFQVHEYLWNIILNTIKFNVIDGVPLEVLECDSAKQLFLATGF